MLQALTPLHAQKQLGITLLSEGVTPVQGFGIEFFLGFVLVLVVFGVCDVNRSEVKGLAPVAIGLTIAMGHLAVVSIHVNMQLCTLTVPVLHSATVIM
jgi:aquaporin related protein